MAFVETGFGIANLEVGDSRRVLAKESGDGFFCGKAAFIGSVAADAASGLLSGETNILSKAVWVSDAAPSGAFCLTPMSSLPVKVATMTSPKDVSVTSSTTPLM